METAAFVIGCVAFALSVVSLGWQVFAWLHARRFDVRVRMEADPIPVAEGKYPVTVVIENHGSTVEAVQEVWLLYAEHYDLDKPTTVTHLPSLRDPKGGVLPPRRSVRRTYELMGGNFGPFPLELMAVVLLESDNRVTSSRFKTSESSHRVALGFDPTSDPADGPR